MVFGKPWEFWIALAGAAVYTATRDAEKAPIKARLAKVFVGGALGYALADEFAPLTWGSETLAAVLIMALGVLILDVIVAVISDRETILSFVKSNLPGRKKDG